MKLTTKGALSRLSAPHIDPPSVGRHVSERINVAMILKAFQLILGREWVPLEVHITSPDGYWLEKLMPSGDFKVKKNSREVAFCFKTDELAAKNKNYSSECSLQVDSVESLEDITIKILNSFKGNYLPTIDEFSEYFGYSNRTIIRSFTNAGTSYKQLVDKHIYINALRLLENYAISIDEISAMFGYAHPSNFIKAFKRWTSVTPNAYRQQRASF